jgi:hypothetical protein
MTAARFQPRQRAFHFGKIVDAPGTAQAQCGLVARSFLFE